MWYLSMGLFLLLQACSQSNPQRYSETVRVEADDTEEIIMEKAASLVPSDRQLAAIDNEFIAFIHFGPNTFTRMEWGSGKEDPKVFDLKELHTDQWCEAMKAAGMKMAILTVKHHDGFCLWQTRYTTHGVMSTGFRDGKGDVLRELSESCQKYGIKLGVYLSPADLFQIESPDGLYGNLSTYSKRTIPREVPGRPFKNKTTFEFEVDDYNEYFLNQLFELLTEYGPVHEVWFDGAHPKRKGGQKYNYGAWRELIRTLAPNAVVFGKEDIRWCGNEGGGTRATEWNVIPYAEDPAVMNDFPDLTKYDLGSREALLAQEKPFYLHYQPAETNTSIRAGWFYSNDETQGVRNADEVFDMYERSVGGNSIFLLNIPPSREGKFPAADVEVLREVGERINATYGKNLFDKAKGPRKLLDKRRESYLMLTDEPREVEITTSEPVTVNRIALREPITKVGERVEQHAVDAFLDGQWVEIAQATNIGNRRILRFPAVTSNRFRVRILKSRLAPALSEVSAYFYEGRPPQLNAKRDLEGLVTLEAMNPAIRWNSSGQNSAENLNRGYTVYYTTNGTEPDTTSTPYSGPFLLENGQLKAFALLNGRKGALLDERFGLLKKGWKVMDVSSERQAQPAKNSFDENRNSYWLSEQGNKHFLAIDLGLETALSGFAYTPQTQNGRGMIESGVIKVSSNGRRWEEAGRFSFGNLVNDPTKRTLFFEKAVKARYVRIEATAIAGGGDVASMAELDLFAE